MCRSGRCLPGTSKRGRRAAWVLHCSGVGFRRRQRTRQEAAELHQISPQRSRRKGGFPDVRARVVAVAALCLAVCAGRADAQCKGDFNNDGRVTIDELVVAVDNALSGCAAGQPRFVDNGDGTITDHRTGLMWEKKDGLNGRPNEVDLHDADNTYQWAGSCLPSSLEVLCQPTAEALRICPAGEPGCTA